MDISTVINSNEFHVTPHVATNVKSDNTNAANRQELEFISQLNKCFRQRNMPLYAVWSKERKSYIGEEWTPKLDREDGDIYIFITSGNNVIGPIKYIDLKVTDHGSIFNDLPATITRESFDVFSKRSDHLYVCMNSTGTRLLLIDAVRLRTVVQLYERNNKNPWNVSKHFPNNRKKDYIKGNWLIENYELIKMF